MLGDFVDDYTVKCVDVFAMPQRGTSMTVEAVDPVFQQQMLEMLKQTGRPEMVVGWYHSHPGWGCWLSGVDVNTQQSFEQLNSRSVAVVVDPVISVKGKVVIDAFRCIPRQSLMLGLPSRQTTSVLGHLKPPSLQALVHGLNRDYYSLIVSFRKNDLEMKMLSNLHRRSWKSGCTLPDIGITMAKNITDLTTAAELMPAYAEQIDEENTKSQEELKVERVGQVNAQQRLGNTADILLARNITQVLGTMIGMTVF